MNKLDPQLENFFKRLMDHAIHSAIQSIFWKMPLFWTLVILGGLIWAAVYFKLY